MGDRSNVVIQDKYGENTERVWLYGHWSGAGILDAAVVGATSGRTTDGPYLARIVFTSMTAGDTGETGFGISTRMQDNEHPIIVLDANADELWFEGDHGEELTKHVPMRAGGEAIVKALAGISDEYDDEARYGAAMSAVGRIIA
jgi:hypothetical protein